MATFNDLPLELLPDIVQNVVQPRSLASFCLVNRIFCKLTLPFLYHTISILSWHNKEKFVRVFRTLSSSPELARHVQKLEIRYFPKGFDGARLLNLVDSCLRGLANTVKLRSCIWTRDGSLTSDVLLAILRHPSLEELEINGFNHVDYDPNILPRFTSLRHVKLIIPSLPVLEVLPTWLKSLVNPLQSLSIVGYGSPLLTDALLEKISEDLSGLKKLELVECRGVTHEGLLKALRHNKNGIECLCIEMMSSSLDLTEFDRECQKTRLLRRLTSLTIAIHPTPRNAEWAKDIPSLVSSSPLEYFQLYSTTMFQTWRDPMNDFIPARVVSSHGSLLKRFSLHRLPISLKALDDVCIGFTSLEQLFIALGKRDMEFIGNSLSKATKLQAVHINFTSMMVEAGTSYIPSRDALHVVNKCSPTLTQVGFDGLVWQVVRKVVQVGEGKETMVDLVPYDQPEVPDQFLVV